MTTLILIRPVMSEESPMYPRVRSHPATGRDSPRRQKVCCFTEGHMEQFDHAVNCVIVHES